MDARTYLLGDPPSVYITFFRSEEASIFRMIGGAGVHGGE